MAGISLQFKFFRKMQEASTFTMKHAGLSLSLSHTHKRKKTQFVGLEANLFFTVPLST